MSERKQDTWRVIINAQDGSGKNVFPLRIEGVVDLPRPMTAPDAADYALRCVVVGPLYRHYGITVDVWGRADVGSEIMRLCSAVAKYSSKLDVHLRYTPWLGEGTCREIGDPEGAVILPVGQEVQ